MSFTCVIYVQPHPSPLPHTRIRPCRHKTVLSEPVDGASGCGHGTAAALGLPELTRDTADTAMAYVGNHPDYCGTAVVTMAGGSRLQTKATETSNKSNRDYCIEPLTFWPSPLGLVLGSASGLRPVVRVASLIAPIPTRRKLARVCDVLTTSHCAAGGHSLSAHRKGKYTPA